MSCNTNQVAPPAPVLPVPSMRQLAWQQLEFYAFVHFNMNTFTNMEWGTGGEDPKLFNPTALDCRQWVQTFKEAGMKGVIITAKHHDGFCLWPSKYTEHSVKEATWKDGDGDVIRELADACDEYGLKLGIYYSPWDRNHADYGTPDYLMYMRRQLKELLTQYGDIFEVWFDGANGGTGYYGGANEERRVDKLRYYDWENTYALIREWQPNAVIFSDAGPDVRWVGNENGHSYPTIWSNLMRDSVYGGMPTYHTDWADGQENGTHWVPAETNVSIRPGWYYHDYEDHKVKSMPKLVNIYYESIGMNTPLLLNFPVDRRGLIHENDVAQLKKMMKKIQEDFSDNLALRAQIEASNVRGDDFQENNIIDDNWDTYWATSDSVIKSSLTLTWDSLITVNRLLLQEYIALGQRIKSFDIEYLSPSQKWIPLTKGTTVGYKRILRFDPVTCQSLRVTIDSSKACPTLSNVAAYFAKPSLYPPNISRSKEGIIHMSIPEKGIEIFYTQDGKTPTKLDQKYGGPFEVATATEIKAIAVDPLGNQSEVQQVLFDIAPVKWQIASQDTAAINIIDGDPESYWSTGRSDKNQAIIDLGEMITIKGFTYLPPQNRWFTGVISEYAFYTRTGAQWRLAQSGEFSNIKNSPVLQRVDIPEQRCRYIMLKALKTLDDNPATFAEVGVLTR